MKFFSYLLWFALPVFIAINFISGSFSSVSVFANDSLAHEVSPEEATPNPWREQFRLIPIPEIELRRMASRGSTSGRARAGTRGDCPAIGSTEPSLTAIVPTRQETIENRPVEIAMGTTISAYPTFWFYLPYANADLHSVRFVVNDESEMPLFEPVVVPLNSQTPGLVSVQLPPSSPPLETGKYYRWYMMLDCSPAGGSDAYVDAYVQRVAVSPEVATNLEAATSLERIELLLNSNAWHEAVDELYRLQLQSPSQSDVLAQWTALLEIGGLALGR